MIINYDRRPSATVDEKIQSLIESIQLALNDKSDNTAVRELEKKINDLTDRVNNL